MPVFVLTPSDIMQPSMPLQLQGQLDAGHWNAIRSAMINVMNTAQSMTCLMEWGICCVFAFPCIFCCHQCVYNAVLDGTWQQ